MTIPDVTIEDIKLHLDNSGRYIEGKVQVSIALKNNSSTMTYYVLKRPGDMDYDRGSQTLSIGLCEKQLPKDSSSPFEPEQIVILPGATLEWQYMVPVWMKKITRPAGLREVVEVVNISDVQKVDCAVACHSRPTRAAWIGTVTSSFERRLI